MAKVNFIQRHIDIINLLENKPRNFIEIQNYFENKEVYKTLKTFQRDMKDIEELYNRTIRFNRKDKVYEIESSEENNFNERILNEISLINAIQLSKNVSQFFFLDDIKANGIENLNGIIHCLENKCILEFNYHATFHKNEITNRIVEPLAVKEVQNRWYLIGFDINKKQERTFALERISDFNVTKKTFLKRKIDVVKKYENAFGIECEGNLEKIVLRFSKKQEPYIIAKPIHKSQKKISETKTNSDFEYFMYQSNDLLMEIMKLGESVEVMSPSNFRERAKIRISEMMNLYK